jgi:integrase
MPSISIGRLRGGFCVYWTGADGNRRRYQLEARSRKEAEAEGRDRYLRETAAPTGLTIADLWAAYTAHLGDKPTAATMGYTGKAVLAAFGLLRPDQITIDDCRRYTADRMRAGRKQGSVHTELGHLRSTLRWAEKAGLIAKAPHIERPAKPASDVRPLTDAQIRALMDGCGAPHIRLAVILLLATGARVGAVLDLTWQRVDLDRGVIDLRLPDGVTRKGRAVVPINRMARAALESAWPARLTDHVVEWGGKPVRSIRRGYQSALDRAGLVDVNIHQIRHSVAVRMLAAGQPIEAVAQYLGHSNTAITYRTYARFMPEHLASAAEVLNFDRFSEPGRTSQIGGK